MRSTIAIGLAFGCFGVVACTLTNDLSAYRGEAHFSSDIPSDASSDAPNEAGSEVGAPDAGSPDQAAAATLEQACAALATAQCDQLILCTSWAFRINFDDRPSCIFYLERQCEIGMLSPGVTANPDDLIQCAEALNSTVCHAPSPPECDLPHGTLPAGTACIDDMECEGGFCADNDASFCGKCSARAKLGEPCGALGGSCEGNLVCVDSVCEKAGFVGDACDAANPCALLPCIGGKCTAWKDAGDACDTDEECGLGKTCSNAICELQELVPLGKACNGSAPCLGNASCVAGICLHNLAEGAACVPNSGAKCQVPNICLNGVCTRVQQNQCA